MVMMLRSSYWNALQNVRNLSVSNRNQASRTPFDVVTRFRGPIARNLATFERVPGGGFGRIYRIL